jgi:hypothetical protein
MSEGQQPAKKSRFSLPTKPPTAPSAAAFVSAADRSAGSPATEKLIPRFLIRLTDTNLARLQHHCAKHDRSQHYFASKALLELLDRLDAEEGGAA